LPDQLANPTKETAPENRDPFASSYPGVISQPARTTSTPSYLVFLAKNLKTKIAKNKIIYPLHLKMRILENVGFENYQ